MRAFAARAFVGTAATLFALSFVTPAGSGSAAPTPEHHPTVAPCTRSGIRRAVDRDTSLGRVTAVGRFACARSWAYAGITVGAAHGFDAVVLLRSVGGRWIVADRARACSAHLVPKPLYRLACTTS